MDLSIVTTLYRSAPYLEEFYARARAAAEAITSDFEIIFVNDGSPDNSLDVALSLFEKDERVKVIDLEEEPELLELFYRRLKETGADVVYGVQQQRKGGLFERLTGALYFRLFNFLSTYPVPANLITARLMTGRYVAALVSHRERELCLSGLWAITGFEQV